MMIIFRLLKVATPVPTAFDKFLHNRVIICERSAVLRTVKSPGWRNNACRIDYRILHGIDVHGPPEGVQG